MILVAFSVMPVLVMLFYRHPMYLLCLFPVTNAIYEGLFPDGHLIIGGFLLVPTDPLYFFTITTLGLCALQRPRKIAAALKENIFLTMFLALMALYVLVYTPTHGQSAIGEARKLYFFFLIPLLAAVAIKTPADLRLFILVIVWTAAGLALIGFGTAIANGILFRPINAHSALTLACAAFLMLIHHIYRIVLVGPILDKVFLWLFFAGAVTAGHRTVWLAIGSGLLLAFLLYGRKRAFIGKVLLVLTLTIPGIGIGIALVPETAARFGTAFEGIFDPEDDVTASWRIDGWQYHLDRVSQDGKILFGEGLGGYYGKLPDGTIRPVPHSAYVEMILKFGLFGLVVYSLLVFKFVRNALAARKTLKTGPLKICLEAGILTFVAGHAYCSGYSLDSIMLMFFAVGTSAQCLSKRESVELPASRGQHFSTYRNLAASLHSQRLVRPRT
jgi:O-antigen ligase